MTCCSLCNVAADVDRLTVDEVQRLDLERARCQRGEADAPSCVVRKDGVAHLSALELAQGKKKPKIKKLFVRSLLLFFFVEIAQFGTMAERRYLQHILAEDESEQESLYADCLVDAWVSHSRFAFLDLSGNQRSLFTLVNFGRSWSV